MTFKNIHLFRIFFLVTIFNIVCPDLSAQISKDTLKEYPLKTIMEIFKEEKSALAIKKPVKNDVLLIFPAFGMQPAYGFTFGVLSLYTFRKRAENKFSSINAGGSYTTKNQVLTYFKNNMYLNNDELFLSGDWRYYVFSQSNYGLGSDIIPSNWKKENFDIQSIEQPMEYNYLKIHQTISWNVLPSFYVGTGLHLDGYTNINDKNLDVENEKFTYHYDYSKKHGFNDKHYYVNGFSLNLIYDTRDNLVNTNKGFFVNLNYRHNPSILKNQFTNGSILAETRYFIPLSKTNKQHVLGFWAYGQYLVLGKVPYLNLPALGWDQRSRSGKGYTQGLIRGSNLMYFETEYRFPITKNQMISGTVFANATTASDIDRNVKLMHYFQPAAGVGLRILLDKETLTNFIINYGFGRDSNTFYFNDGEGF